MDSGPARRKSAGQISSDQNRGRQKLARFWPETRKTRPRLRKIWSSRSHGHGKVNRPAGKKNQSGCVKNKK